MKQLTCEMCGSTDLMKQDGVFVCQSCGMKYSVEEAKSITPLLFRNILPTRVEQSRRKIGKKPRNTITW